MRSGLQLTKVRMLPVVTLALFVSFVWCADRNRLNDLNWDVPADYFGDSNAVLAFIKAASELDYLPVGSETIHRLGVPYEAEWADFPMYGKPLTLLLGLMARWFGLFEATNIGVLLGHVLSALAFYFCCRLLRWRREWAWVFAALYSFTYYNLYRNFAHLFLAFSYTVPLTILSSWIIGASRRVRWGDTFSWVCLATAVIEGLSNPYYLCMYLQLAALALAFNIITRRRKQNLQIGFASLGLGIVAFLAINSGTILYWAQHGKNPWTAHRRYLECEIYALKLVDLVIPPDTHNFAPLANIGNHYATVPMGLRGEIFSPYLGLVGLAGLLWVAAEFFMRVARRSCVTPAVHGAQILWVFMYATIGGLNCLVALGGIALFRGSNRYSIYISAVVLLFLASRLSRLTSGWKPAWRLTSAAALLGVGLFDQLPRPTTDQMVEFTRQSVGADRVFAEAMENCLPPGAAVCQLPALEWPEGTPLGGAQPDEMLRPYFFSKKLRFSFGNIMGRPREQWQWELETLPPKEMAASLERLGFAAIYIDRRGYVDNGESLLKGLAAAGHSVVLEDGLRQHACVLLTPSAIPELPHTSDRALPLFEKGWLLTDRTPLTLSAVAEGNAEIAFFNPAKVTKRYALTCQILCLTRRDVGVSFQGRVLWHHLFESKEPVPLEAFFEANPGYNHLEFTSDREAVIHSQLSRAKVAFGLTNVLITLQTNQALR